MDRRSFLNITALGAAGIMLPGGAYSLGKNDISMRTEGTVPFEVYCCDIDIPPKEFVQELAKQYEGRFRKDLLEELDYGRKYSSEFMEEFAGQMECYLRYLSGGRFGIKLNDFDVINVKKDEKKYDEVASPYSNKEGYRMIVTTMIEHDSCGIYDRNGVFRVNPFNVQIDRDGQRYFDPTPMHEMFHSFFTGHSLSPGSVMYRNDHRSQIGLSFSESMKLGWPHVKSIDVHPLKYSIKKDGKLKVRRT